MYKRSQLKGICIFISLLFILGAVFTGCSNKDQVNDSSTQETTQQEEQTTANTEKKLEGTINVAFPMGAQKPVIDAIANAYMEKNPGVTVVVDDRDASAYTEWMSNQLASGEVTADVAAINTLGQFASEDKFIDLMEYLKKSNPYMNGQKWMDGLEPAAYRGGDGGAVYNLCVDSVQILWFYNKDIFAKVGVNPPKNWDELVEISKKIKEAGYIPLALPGDASSFYEFDAGWLFRIYSDQYFRDLEPEMAVKDGDYNYDPERDGTWKFDPKDINNDAMDKIQFNLVRLAKLIKDNKTGPDTDKYREMLENFKKMIPQYCEDGFFGAGRGETDQLFYSGKAAMRVDGTWFIGQFPEIMKDAENKFEYGSFWSPPMVGKHVAVDYTRSLGGPVGYLGAINKSKEQNDLTVDFLMYYASPEGQNVRMKAIEESGQSPNGLILVKGVTIPDKWGKAFQELGYNGECDLNPATFFSRMWANDIQSARDFQVEAQQYFNNKMTADELSKKMHKIVSDGIGRWITQNNYREDCLQDPAKDPAKE